MLAVSCDGGVVGSLLIAETGMLQPQYQVWLAGEAQHTGPYDHLHLRLKVMTMHNDIMQIYRNEV